METTEKKRKEHDFSFIGRVVAVNPPQTFPSGFVKRTIVIDSEYDNDKYANPVEFTYLKDYCKRLDNIREGMIVQVRGYFKGREYTPNGGNKKYYCDLVCYDTPGEVIIGSQPSTPTATPTPPVAVPTQDIATVEDEVEDLPF